MKYLAYQRSKSSDWTSFSLFLSHSFASLQEYVRNTDWKFDNELEETMKCLVLRNFKRSEILDFLKRDFPDYSWSLASLSRRMKYSDIKYTDYSTTVEQVRAAFQEENSGPGQLLGYRAVVRAMHKQIREKHGHSISTIQ